jgi:ABC-type branched-subunit amino acid transport system substrate-binding protein
MSKRLAALLAAGALALAACGTRADFSALAQPSAQQTQIIEEVVDASGTVSRTSTGGDAPPSVRDIERTTELKEGSGITKAGTIKIGGLFPLSGGLSALGEPPAKAAKAYFQSVNDAGGINGLKIDFEIRDDRADPNESARLTQELINEGIFAMGPSFTPFSPNVVPILERKGVPWVGYDGINVEGFDSDLVVTVGAPIQTMAHALLPYWYRQAEQRLGRAPTRIGAVVLDVPPARTYVEEAEETICPALGCQIVQKQFVSYFTLHEYSQICATMRTNTVDTVWIITDPASAVKLLVQCDAAGYSPPAGFLGQHGVYLDLTVEQSGDIADGMIANSALLPPSVDHPANRSMKRTVGRYESDVDYGYFTSLAYASARMTVDVLREAIKIDPELGRASVLAAAAKLRSYDCHGLCRDVNLAPPAATSGGNHHVWLVRARYDRDASSQWVFDGGPVDAFRSETWRR